MTDPRFTEYALTDAKMRALKWLPADGSWGRKPGKIHSALRGLKQSFRDHLEMRVGPLGPRGGTEIQWRLTEAGRVMRATVFPETT
jgi:hypothetical protein